MVSRRKRQRGSAMVEFALTGIVLMFTFLGIVQMGIGMWCYTTLQYAVKAAGSYASVRGSTCSSGGNSCTAQIKDVAALIKTRAPGLTLTDTNVTFRAINPTDHSTVVSTATCRLDNCLTDTRAFPLTGYTAPGQELSIHVNYLFRSALGIVIPGHGVVQFGVVNFPGYTYQIITF